MKCERATYSRAAVLECRDAGKAFQWGIEQKSDHNLEKVIELRKLYDLFYEKTGCILFDPDGEPYFEEYRNAVWKYKSTTRDELDKLLRHCRRYLSNELCGIWQMMNNGEVNAVD